MDKLVVIHNRGEKIFGNLCTPKEGVPCIVMAHGLEGNKDGNKWLALSAKFHDIGIGSLRFSFRGCGKGREKSEGDFEDTTLTGRISDYKAAIGFLGNTGVDINRLGVIGSSLGGMVAIAARDERIKAMITIATPSHFPSIDKQEFKQEGGEAYFQLDSGQRLRKDFFDDIRKYTICDEISKIQSPFLIIHGTEDKLVPVQNANELYCYANEPKQLEIVEGANHSFDNPEHVVKLVNLSLKWFRTYL